MRTEQGKNISSQNATKHGGCSEKHLIIGDESSEDFEDLQSMWMQSYMPRDLAEHHMVEQLTRADWFFQRAERNMAEVEFGLMESGSPADWTEEQEKKLLRMQRYLTARSNLLAKAKKSHRRLPQEPHQRISESRKARNRQADRQAQSRRRNDRRRMHKRNGRDRRTTP